MADVKGKFITLAGSLMAFYETQLKKADEELFKSTGKHWDGLDPEGWYNTKIFNSFMQSYAEGSPTKDMAIVTLGKKVYPTIKASVGLPPNLKTPLDFIKFEAEGFLANHRGADVKPRKFLLSEDKHVIIQAPAPGYNPKLFEGVYLGILEMCGIRTGKVVQLKAAAKGQGTDEFDIRW
ncbi:MAG: hypothetical protein APF81_09490 [Desulfosporosinus sp. BRH_c37]|nr:MAG: hypothetical protein APF81_09490 [Desulfosporosinus sp. BRH_c37]